MSSTPKPKCLKAIFTIRDKFKIPAGVDLKAKGVSYHIKSGVMTIKMPDGSYKDINGVYDYSWWEGHSPTHEEIVDDSDTDNEDEWQEVYNAGEHNKNAKPQLFKDVKGDTFPEYNEFKYYQTYGGGPEGGYITDGIIVAKVHRDWGIPFSVEVIKGTLIFRPGNDMEGRSNAIKITLE